MRLVRGLLIGFGIELGMAAIAVAAYHQWGAGMLGFVIGTGVGFVIGLVLCLFIVLRDAEFVD